MTAEDIIAAAEAQTEDSCREAEEASRRKTDQLIDINGHRLDPIEGADGKRVRCLESAGAAPGAATGSGS